MALPTGHLLDQRYRLLRVIGEHEGLVTYEADDLLQRHHVAVERPDVSADHAPAYRTLPLDEAVSRFRRSIDPLALRDVDGVYDPEPLIDAPVEYAPDLPAPPIELDRSAFREPEPVALELDRPPPAPPDPSPPFPWRRVAMTALLIPLLAGAAYAAMKLTKAQGKDVHVTIADVPPGARLTLDGVPIEGHDLVLTRSAETHVVGVSDHAHGTRLMRFTAEEDRTLSAAPAP
jgi:hypothetical protein